MICIEVAFHGGIPDTGFYRFWIQGIFARWPNNPNIEGLIQAQKDHTLLIAIGKHVKYLFLKFVFRYLLVPVGLHKVYTIVVHLKALNKQAQLINGYMFMVEKSGKAIMRVKI